MQICQRGGKNTRLGRLNTTFAHFCLFQLEKVLKAQIDGWEQEHSREFLVSGRKFLEYVQEQWESHHSEKEKEKLERVGRLIWCFDFISAVSGDLV